MDYPQMDRSNGGDPGLPILPLSLMGHSHRSVAFPVSILDWDPPVT